MPRPNDATMTGTPKLDATFVEQVRQPIAQTFHALIDTSFDFEGMSRLEAMEMALDASYLRTYGFPQAEALVDAACKAYGYPKVLRFLAKHIAL